MKCELGLLYSPRFLEHDAGPGHPESPERLRAVWKHLNESGLARQLRILEPQPHPLRWIERVHDPSYVRRAREACLRGEPFLDTADTGICAASFEVAVLAVSGALTLVDEVMVGKIQRGFGLLRPPGHHAERETALGFCLFNNIAIAVRYAQARHRVERIAIVDWDVHHGNGTQHAFEQEAGVLCVSTHQWPLYPGTGRREERGQGNLLNIPLPPGAGDAEYLACFEKEILPALHRHRPELIFISAGFDAHRNDPLAQMEVTEEGYRRMTEMLTWVADEHAKGRIISLLEGGYHLPSLARSVEEHLRALMAPPPALGGKSGGIGGGTGRGW